MVKCVNCGFLGGRDPNDNSWAEADDIFRETGRPHSGSHLSGFPACFAGVINIKELAMAVETEGRDKKVLSVINTEIDCDEFMKWRPGDNPKEHREWRDSQRLQEWQVRRDDDMQKWRVEVEQKAEARHKEQLKSLQRIHIRELVVFGGAVTLAIIVITIVGAAIEAGWIAKWFGIG